MIVDKLGKGTFILKSGKELTYKVSLPGSKAITDQIDKSLLRTVGRLYGALREAPFSNIAHIRSALSAVVSAAASLKQSYTIMVKTNDPNNHGVIKPKYPLIEHKMRLNLGVPLAAVKKNVDNAITKVPAITRPQNDCAIYPRRLAANGLTVGLFNKLATQIAGLALSFPEVDLSNPEYLAVNTAAITLEKVFLGSFSIRLSYDSIANNANNVYAFEIVANDPHPAITDGRVTHPHVSEQGLCAGEAEGAIQLALEQWRITDAFLLVKSVLTTYNPGSPYVNLARWYGDPCYNCSAVIAPPESEDDDPNGIYCAHCRKMFCDKCKVTCNNCQTQSCPAAAKPCLNCKLPCCANCRVLNSETNACRGCAYPCTVCSKWATAASLVDGKCATCIAKGLAPITIGTVIDATTQVGAFPMDDEDEDDEGSLYEDEDDEGSLDEDEDDDDIVATGGVIFS